MVWDTTKIINYEISSQCKAIKNWDSEQTYDNVGCWGMGFFLSDLIKDRQHLWEFEVI
jgi:hypothetical protein